jgi:hypothetical protein
VTSPSSIAGRLSRSAPRLPTHAADWRLVVRTARLVLSIPTYALLAAVVALLSLSLFVVSQNVELAVFALRGPLALSDRLSVLAGLYPFVGSLYDPLLGGTLAFVAALVGVDAALLAYHVRRHGLSIREGTGGTVGLVLGTLGAGCAACGSAVLAGVFSLFGAAGLLTLLPLEGLEFVLLAVPAIGLSLFWIADGMRGGEIRGCPIEPPT